MTVFDPRGELRSLERNRISAARAEPNRFLAGDPANGFYTTPKLPELGYWGVALHSKRINADLENPGNLVTWIANRIAGLVGSEKRFVSVGAGSFLGAAAFGDSNARSKAEAESVSVFKYLSNRFSPLQDVSAIDRILSFKDESFEPEQALQDFVKTSPDLVNILLQNGRDLNMFLVATNRDAFQFIMNRELIHIQALEQIAQFNSEVGALKNISNKIISGAFNYLAFDPSFAPSLAIGVGGVRLAANAARAGGGILRLGERTSRINTAVLRLGEVPVRVAIAPTKLPAPAALQVVAAAVTRAGGAPAAAHAALAGRWSVAAATGVELSLMGIAWDAAIQQERLRDWNQIFEGTDWEREFSFGELALSGLIGGALGFTLSHITGAISGTKSADRARRAAIDMTGGDADNIVAREGFNNPQAVRAQAHEDVQATQIQMVVEEMVGGQRSADLGFLIDRVLLDESGLLLDDVTDLLKTIALVSDGEIVDSVPVIRLFQELFAQGKAARIAGDVTDEIGDMLMRQARNRALMQALDEGIDVTNRPAFRERIGDLTLDHLEELRRVPVETPVGIRADMGEDELRALIVRMDKLSKTRKLTDIEEEQMLWAAQSLDFLTGKEFVTTIAPRFNVGRFVGATDFDKKIMELHTDALKLAEARRLPKSDKTTKLIRKLQQRIRRRSAAIGKQFPAGEVETGVVRAEALDTVKTDTTADRQRAFDASYVAPDAGAASIMEDVTYVGKVMRSAGLGTMFARLATQKTGQFQTVRSVFAGIRELAEVFDHSRFTVESLGPSGPEFIGNLTDNQRELVRTIAPMAEFIDKLASEGFFGKIVAAITGKKRAAIDLFQEEAFLHAGGLQESSSPEVRELARMWTEVAEKIGKEGVDNGTLLDLEKAFIPIRIEVGKVMRDKVKFRKLLTEHFTDKWLKSESVHMDTLVTMGWAERIATKGRDVEYKLLGPLEGLSKKPVSTLKRAALGDSADFYTRAITDTVDDQGFTGIAASMRRVVDNLTNEGTFVEESGRIILDDATGAVSRFERRLDKDMLANPELREFFRTDLMSLASDYVRHNGFDIKANSLVQRLRGIRGLKFTEYMDFQEAQLLKAAKEGTDERAIIKSSMNALREKWLRMSGRERRLLSHAEKVGEFGADVAEAGTLVFYAGPIGQTIVLEEMLVGLVNRNYNPIEFARQVRVLLSGLNPLTHKKTFRENAGYTSLAVRLNQQINAERFTGGSVQSDFQWGTIDKILAPWRTLRDTIFGRTAPGPRSLFGRLEAVPQAIQALGRTSLTLGGSDFFTRNAMTLQLVSQSGEIARFFKPAQKLTRSLLDNADLLKSTNRTAREKALARGANQQAAIRAGNLAEFKVWKGFVRKAGFGEQWQVAQRFSQHGILDESVLGLLAEAGEATKSLKTRGFLPMMDINRMSKYVNDIDPERATVMQDALNRVINMFERTTIKRVSEQTILQTPTNDASRVFHGRYLNTMTSFARSFFDNTVLDLARMPSRNAVALATTYVLGATMSRISRRILNGEDFDSIMQEFEDRPIPTMLNYALNVPIAGQFNYMLRMVSDPLLSDRFNSPKLSQGAAVSVANETLRLASLSIKAIGDESVRDNLSHSAEKFARRITPGLNSHFGGLFMLGTEAAFDVRLRMDNTRRNRTGRRQDVRFQFDDTARVPDFDLGKDLVTPEDEVTDFSFMLPLIERKER